MNDEMIDSIWQSYTNLDEKEKAKICREIYKVNHGLFVEWKKRAGLSSGGFSDKNIKLRASEHIKNKLDSALENDRSFFSNVVRELSSSGFMGFQEEYDDFLSLRIERTSPSEAMQKFLAKNKESALADLYSQVKYSSEGYLFPEKADLTDADTTLSMLQEVYSKADDYTEGINSALKKFIFTGDLSIFEERLNGFHNVFSALIAYVQYLSKEIGIEYTSLDNIDDMIEYVNVLKEALASISEESEAVVFLDRLATHLSLLESTHRSPRKREEINKLLESAAEDLRNPSESVLDVSIPDEWPQEPQEWMEWVTSLDSECFESACSTVRKLSKNLLYLVESIEPYQLKIRSCIEEVDTSGKDMSEQECEEDEESGQASHAEMVEVSPESSNSSASGSKDFEKSPDQTCKREEDDTSTEPLPEVEVSCPIEVIAERINSEGAIPVLLSAFAWKLLVIQEYHAALSVAYYAERNTADNPSTVFDPPSWLCELAILNDYYYSHSRAMSLGLRRYFSRYTHAVDSFVSQDDKQAFTILMCAYAAKMALLSQAFEPRGILESPEIGSVDSFFHLISAILKFSNTGHVLSPALVSQTLNESEYESIITDFRRSAAEMLGSFKKRHIISRPAQDVWNSWTGGDEDSYISNILRPVISGDEGETEGVTVSINHLLNDGIAETAEKTYAKLHRGNLISRAKNQIVRHTEEALELASRWVETVENHRSLNERSFRDLKKLLKVFTDYYAKAKDELLQLAQGSSNAGPVLSIGLAMKVLDGLYQLLQTSDWPKADSYTREVLLYTPMLRFGSVSVSSLEELKDSDEVFKNSLAFFGKDRGSLEKTVNHFCSNGRHDLAERLVEGPEPLHTSDAGIPLDGLKQFIKSDRKGWQQRIFEAALTLSNELGKAFLNGYMENDRESVKIQSYCSSLLDEEELDKFDRYDLILREMNRKIEFVRGERSAQSRKLLAKLNEIKDKVSKDQYEHLQKLAENAEAYTFENYLQMVNNDQELPAMDQERGVFQSFFSSQEQSESIAAKIENALLKGPVGVIRAIDNRQQIAGIDLKRLSGKQASEKYKHLLELWFTIKKNKKIDDRMVRKILSLLDFPVKTVKTNNRQNEYEVCTETIEDRNICAVPQFGSQAKGSYRVICEWEFPTEDLLLSKVAEKLVDNRNIVLYFGRVTEKRRRELSREARTRSKSLLVLDDILLVFLCTQRQSPLPVFFDCSIPFSWAQAYNITSSYVPVEMFYGRKKELASILYTAGSCVVYGGRQLGKTALLTKAREEFHSPEKGRVSIYLDLKSELVGRAPDDIWRILVISLKNGDILPRRINERTGPDRLKTHILEWLQELQGRRILLLLDEADKLLKWDSEQQGNMEFAIVHKLKDIMDTSEKRFKVVFSGLHNVQRTIRNPNSPLAHLGEPLCIGPLFNEDVKEARELIRKPFRAMGYEFENEDLITKILAQTNYYPSLIQIYCLHLHRYLQENLNSFSEDEVPPYQITKKHVDGAYRTRNLRDDIRNRFMWTLDLDVRFRILTDIIALWGNESDGIPFRDLMLHASDILQHDSPFSATDTMRAILDEMQGLGIVIRQKSDYYNFSSQNVRRLLGEVEEIESDLLHSMNKLQTEPVDDFDLGETRRNLDGVSKSYLLSSLTTSQEQLLRSYENDVVVCFACKAAGLQYLRMSLEKVFGEDSFISLDSSHNVSSLEVLMREIVGEGHHCIYIPEETAWTMEWLSKAQDIIGRKYSKRSIVKIVFSAGPNALWDLRNILLYGTDFTLLHIAPWTENVVKNWMNDNVEWRKYTANSESVKKICLKTGNWPMNLYLLMERLRSTGEMQLESLLDEVPTGISVLNDFNFDKPWQTQVLLAAALVDATSSEILAKTAHLEGIEKNSIDQVIRWADSLGYLYGKCSYDDSSKVVNSYIADLLMTEEEI